MSRQSRNKVQKSLLITWFGIILATLILTYGPHGPARHPRMMLIILMPIAAGTIIGLRSYKVGLPQMLLQGVLFGLAALTGFLLANTLIGDGIPAVTTTVVCVVLAMISLATSSTIKANEPAAEIDS